MRSTSLAALIGLAALSVTASSRANPDHHHQETAPDAAIAAAVATPSRTPANTARDRYRHPAETLAFFGVGPAQTVFEYAPGGGWYSEILGPLLREKGTFYASPPAGKYHEMFAKTVAETPEKFGNVKIVSSPLAPGAVPPGSVDTVLTFRNVHNLVMSGTAADAFAAFFTMLKPGGTLGVVDHRLPESAGSALEKSSGYAKTSTVRALAEKAGFELVGESEINANPKDTADHPKGVWTLPPNFALGDQDREKYAAIGESDRMTLRFRKPAA